MRLGPLERTDPRSGAQQNRRRHPSSVIPGCSVSTQRMLVDTCRCHFPAAATSTRSRERGQRSLTRLRAATKGVVTSSKIRRRAKSVGQTPSGHPKVFQTLPKAPQSTPRSRDVLLYPDRATLYNPDQRTRSEAARAPFACCCPPSDLRRQRSTVSARDRALHAE